MTAFGPPRDKRYLEWGWKRSPRREYSKRVVALADAGIAMGGLGSDATIETADIVIQNDQPSKIVTAIKIGKITRQIVWQNITIAMVIKVIVLVLGAGGIATLWEAVIADVGVALLAILNAVRIQRMKI